MDKWIIRINVVVLVIWYVFLPFSAKFSLFSLGGTEYDLSRLVGMIIIFGNTLLLPIAFTKKIPTPLLITSALFTLYSALLLLVGNYLLNSLEVFVRVYSGFLLLFIYCGFDYEHKNDLIEKLLLFMGLFTATYTLIQFSTYYINPQFANTFFGDRAFVASYSTVRPQGPLLSAGGSASVMSLALFILLKYIIINKFNRIHTGISIIIALAMMINLTRTYVFMLIVLIILCLIFYRKFLALVKIGLTASALIIISFTILPPQHYLDRFKDVPGVSSHDVSGKQMMQGRGLLFDIIWNDYKDKDIYRQITGDGLYYTNKLLGKYFGVAGASTHNDFLWILSNMGLIGLLLYLLHYIVAAACYRGQFNFLFFCYLFGIMFASGIGGETISVTGHRFLQVIFLAYFYSERPILNKELAIT